VSQLLIRFLFIPLDDAKSNKESWTKTEESKVSNEEDTVQTSLSSELKLNKNISCFKQKRESRNPLQKKKYKK